MSVEAPVAPLTVYMLADHLDGALAAGEDLISAGVRWRECVCAPRTTAEALGTERQIVEDVRAFELMLIARALKAREHARDLGQQDKRFEPIANLFVSGTAILVDAVAECGDATADDFDTGDTLVSYARSRSLIAPDAATIMDASQLTIDDSFQVAKRLGLGPLLDMVAAFLDALEIHYALFITDDVGGEETAAVAPRRDFGKRERLPVN